MKRVIFVSLMLANCWNAHAKSFDVVGGVFPVAEKAL